MNSSISRQLVLWLAVPLMLLSLCGALVHYFNSVAPGVIDSDRRLKEAAGALMAHLQVKDGQVVLDVDAATTPHLPPPDSVAYVLRDSRGRLLAGDAQLAAAPMNGETSQLLAMTQWNHHPVRSLTTRFDTSAGVVLITVADSRPVAERAARYGFMSTLLWDFVQLDVTLVLVWVGIQLGLRPVRKLREEIAARSPLDLRPIDEATVPRELAPVVVTLNRLFTTLRSSVQSQQQFIANTAHQLRTPITGLQAQLDLLLAEAAAAPVKTRLLTLQEGIRQLAHSANQLLTLARADPAVNIAAKLPIVDLKSIVGEVVARFYDRALSAKIDLGVEATSTSIQADPSLLDDLLSNLVDNALKYTPAGGSVTVSAGRAAGGPCLSVTDTGPGIPEKERSRVRERFYRLPNSPGHGSGLGLAIVDEIARLNDAAMTIESGPNGCGTRISILFQAGCVTTWTPRRESSASRRFRPVSSSPMRPQSFIQYGRSISGPDKAAGFTLVELVIVCTIVGILLAVGVPSFRYVTTSNRVSAEINGLLGDLQYARSEAIREGLTISVCPTSNGSSCLTTGSAWQSGWLVFSDLNSNGSIDGNDQVLKIQRSFTGTDTLSIDNNLQFVSFNRDGFMMNLATGATFTLHNAAATSNYTRCLTTTIVGALSTLRYGQTTAESTTCS